MTSNNGISFGVILPTMGLKFQKVLEAVEKYEELGFDSAWCYDHFYPYDGKSSRLEELHEPLTTLMAAAMTTKRIRLGTLVLCASFRHPALVAKMCAEIDIASSGRFDLGIGAGWFKDEFDAYGYKFGEVSSRLSILRESIQIIKMLWMDDYVSFEGEHFSLHRAVCSPKPLQKPHPPVWVGGSLSRVLRLTARYADGWNLGFYASNTPEGFREKSMQLDSYCKSAGRNPSKIRRSWHGLILLSTNRDGVKLLKKKYSWMAMGYPYIAGTPEECVEKLAEYVSAGATDFLIRAPEPTNYDSLAQFVDQCISALKT